MVAPFPDLLQSWTESWEECLACGERYIVVHPIDADLGACHHCGSTDVVRDFCSGPHALEQNPHRAKIY